MTMTTVAQGLMTMSVEDGMVSVQEPKTRSFLFPAAGIFLGC